MSIRDDVALPPGDRLLQRIDAGFFKVERLFNQISGLTILVLMLLAVLQVVGRKVFNVPVRGYVDWVEFSMAIFCFLSIAYCQKLGGHVRMELFIGRFTGRTLWFFEIVGTLVAMAVIAILAWYGYEHFLRAWEIGDSTMDIRLPIWPGKLLVVVAFVSLMVRLSIQLAGFVRLFLRPDAEPIGIPLIETVEQVAQHEIDVGLAGEQEKVALARGARAEAD
jgi:TRAP-type mannitol/chloroaromatic compound transport system permease small subunit